MYYAPMDALGAACVTDLDAPRPLVPRFQVGTDGRPLDTVLTAQDPGPRGTYRPAGSGRHAASSGQSRHVFRRVTRSRLACTLAGIVAGSLAVTSWVLFAPDAGASHPVSPNSPRVTVITTTAYCPTEDSCEPYWQGGQWLVREARP